MALKIRTLSLKKNLDVLIKQIARIVIIDISHGWLLDGLKSMTRSSFGTPIIWSENGQTLPEKWAEKDLPRGFSPSCLGCSMTDGGRK